MRFIRKNGRIIPIHDGNDSKKINKKEALHGAATTAIGAGISIAGSHHINLAVTKRFGSKAGIAAMLGSVFVGEYMAAGGSDKFIESMKMKKKTEQRIKNVTAGSLGVLGAVSALRGMKR